MAVLVGTYRPECRDWIQKRKLYNLPFPKSGNESDYGMFDSLVLYADGFSPLAYRIESHFIGDSSFLIANNYPVSDKPHGDKYIIFSLGAVLSAEDVVGARDALICVSSARWQGKVDEAFYEKPYPKVGGKSMAHIWDSLKPYVTRWKTAIAYDPKKGMMFDEFSDFFAATAPFAGPTKPDFTFIDLFAGIGGFRLAMQDCNGKCVFTSEFDPPAQATYFANFGDEPFGDITKDETKNAIPDKFDVVCAGFPCQAFSLAGKRQGFNDNYKGMCRGTLFKEVVEICEKHQPKAVFCENVKGLLIHDKGNTIKVIQGAFEEVGYKFFKAVLNSKDFGVPQNRERVYMVALRKDIWEKLSGGSEEWQFPFPKGTGEKVTLNAIREYGVPARYYLSDVYMETLRRHRARHEAAGHGFGYEIRDWHGIAGAIVCGGMGRERNLVKEERGTPPGLVPETHIKGHINEEGIRKMTPREWARLQGFPEDFKFVLSDVHLYKQFGNSVSIPVIKAISHAIVDQLKLAQEK